MSRSRLLALMAMGWTAVAGAAEPTPAKFVTAGPVVTEVVFALGAGPRVLGIDDTSAAVEGAASLPKLGYQRALSAEAVLALGAKLLLASEEAGPPSVLEQLRNTGVEVVVLSNEHTLDAAKTRIRTLAKRVGAVDRGEALITAMDKDLERAAARAKALKGKPPMVLPIYARGPNALMVSGAGTAADTVIKLAGGVNAVAVIQGSKPLTAEAVVGSAPDVVLMPAGSLQAIGGEEGLRKLPGLSQAKGWRLVTVEDFHFMGLGPHLGQAVGRLQDGFTPPTERGAR